MPKRNNIVIKERKPLKRTNKPVLLPEHVTWLKQPNIITFMSCDFNKMHWRVIVTLFDYLKHDIEKRIGGTPYAQLDLFEDEDEDRIVKISIPIRMFGVSPNHYPDLRKSIKELAAIPVELDVEHPETGEATFNTSLFSAIIPNEGSQRRNVIFRLEREVAKCLVQIDIKGPERFGYTQYIKEIVFRARSKYTIRMYFFISSWKHKGGFQMNIDDFKRYLCINDSEYKDWKDIEKRVLKSAEEELHEKADVWFHYSPVYDADVSLKEPFKIAFKIIRATTDKDKELLATNKDRLGRLLKDHFKFSDKQRNDVLKSVTLTNYNDFMNKVMELYQYINENRNKIRSVTEYAYTAWMKYIEEETEEMEEVK